MTDLPPPTLPNPSQGLRTGRRGPPPRPSGDHAMSTGLRGAAWHPVAVFLVPFVALAVLIPIIMWLLYLGLPLLKVLAHWYSLLLPPPLGS